MPGLTEPNQVGKREDLSDIYSIVDVRGTPFTSRLQKSKEPTNSEFDWQVDKYASPSTAGTVDGTDVSAFDNHAEDRARLGNYVQVLRRTAKVSRLAQDLSNVAGVRSEIAQAAQKKLVEIKRDREAVMLGDSDGQADNGSVPYKTVGLDVWINTTGPTLPRTVPAAYRPASAQVNTTTTSSLIEDTHVQAVLTSIFDTTGMVGDFIWLVGSVLRRRITEMTRTVALAGGAASKVRTFDFKGDSKKIVHSTTVYEGDYGTLEVVSSNWIGWDTATATADTDRGYVLDMDKLHLRSKKRPTVESFPDLGGGPRILVEEISGLQVDNPIGLAKFKP